MPPATAEAAPRCAKCSEPLTGTAKFCSSCGAPAAAPAPPPPDARKRCPGCEKQNEASSKFCFACGTELPVIAAVPRHGDPAGFWIRFLAFAIDIAVLLALQTLLEKRLGLPDPPTSLPTREYFLAAAPTLAFDELVNLVYATLMVGAWGGTVGKLILGLRIVRMDGARPTYGIAFMRWLAQFFSTIPLCLGFVWIGLSPSKRGWHDYLCDTRVVRAKPSRAR